jgi:hypothetical protein
MKLVLLISILLFSNQLIAQMDESENYFNGLSIEKKREITIKELLRDTLKYSKEDTYHSAIGTQNRSSYSQLFVINGKQYFKFDIVASECVVEFIDRYLKNSNLKSITKLNKKQSAILYGISGKNGVSIITLKKLKKANTKNCGFIESKGKRGSNLDQWKEG